MLCIGKHDEWLAPIFDEAKIILNQHYRGDTYEKN